MDFSEFKIGETFRCSGKQYRCTDVGTRVVVAIRIDQVDVVHRGRDVGFGHFTETLSYDQANKDGWFNGPPYAVAEQVFDEDDFAVCEPQP
jgi:hypothetical protein